MSLTEIIDAATAAIVSDPATAMVPMRAQNDLVGVFKVNVRTTGHEFTVDEPKTIGGGDAGPNPVELGLAALGSCQAITYRLWSEKLGIRFDELSIEVSGDLDVRGFFGLDDRVRPGLDSVQLVVAISGPEPSARYQELMRAVDQHCPVLDIFKNAVRVTTVLAE